MLLHGLQAPLLTVTQLTTVHLEGSDKGTSCDLPPLASCLYQSALPMPGTHLSPPTHTHSSLWASMISPSSDQADGFRKIPSSRKPSRAHPKKWNFSDLCLFSYCSIYSTNQLYSEGNGVTLDPSPSLSLWTFRP